MELFELQLNCSSEPGEVMQTNPQYQAVVANHLAEIKKENFEEIIFSENPTAVSQGPCVDEMGMDQKKNEWLNAPIQLLISLMKEMRPQVGNTEMLKTKKKMWQAISEKMCENGYMFNAQQVETKYFSLKRQYKRNKLHNDMNGRKRPTCLYQGELDDLLLQERKRIKPEYLLDEESTVSTPEDDFLDESPSSSKKLFANNRRKTTINKKTLKNKFLKRIDDLADQTKEFENNTLQIFKDLAEMGKRKEERAQREEERKKRKLELLETLVSKLTEK